MRLQTAFAKPVGPRAFAKRRRRGSTGTVVVCAGDSLTHGLASANYVTMLQDDLGEAGYEFVNAGASGDLAFNVLERLDEVIACRPDVVTILVGSNDVAAHINDTWRDQYIKHQRLPQAPTLDWYRMTLEQTVRRIQTETSARIALLEIPMLGEDLDSRLNQLVGRCNAAIHDVGAVTKVSVLPLHARLITGIPSGHQAPVFDGTRRLMGRALAARLLLRRSWNEISARHGFAWLTDHLHCNDRAARQIADLIEEFLTSIPNPRQ